MKVVRLDPAAPDGRIIAEAAAVVRRGGLVAFPTETVYGLGANALDEAAVARIYTAKSRPGFNPLIVHCPDTAAARELVAEWPAAATRLAGAYWPGPLTLVLPRHTSIPGIVTAGLPTVAVRVPAHPVALALLRAAGVPVAAPSANRSTELSPTTADHVARRLGGGADLLLDAGPTAVGIESTVIDLSGSEPRLLRPGTIAAAEIESVLGRALAYGLSTTPEAARASPGMMARHYAPRARLVIGDRGEMERFLESYPEASEVGALLRETPGLPGVAHTLHLPTDPLGYAARLYAALHHLDESGCAVVLVERVPDEGAWAGIADRLRRASVLGEGSAGFQE